MPLSLPKPLQGCYPDQRRRGIGSNRLVSWGAPSLCRQQRWCHTLVAGPIVSSLQVFERRPAQRGARLYRVRSASENVLKTGQLWLRVLVFGNRGATRIRGNPYSLTAFGTCNRLDHSKAL